MSDRFRLYMARYYAYSEAADMLHHGEWSQNRFERAEGYNVADILNRTAARWYAKAQEIANGREELFEGDL